MSAPPVLVVGFRVTGLSVARYLRERGDQVVVAEDDPTEERVDAAAAIGARFLGRPNEAMLEAAVGECRLMVPSPGIPPGHAVYRLAAESGVPVHSELELGWERLAARGGGLGGRPPALVAVTGTNGKTTVVSLVAAMLVASGRTSVAAGNIGLPFVDAAALDVEVLVVEVSSFQLQFTEEFHPSVSCWLNLAEDHLDWHPTMAHYAAAKARIWAAQRAGDVAVLNVSDPGVVAAAASPEHGLDAGVTRVTFAAGSGVAGDFFVDEKGMLRGPGGLELVAAHELRRSLPFDVENALAASATALAAGASPEGCRAALLQFENLPHRVSLVAEGGGVRWYDDSKATTPASVLAATAGFDSVVLIAGGHNKGLDLGVLARAVPPVRAVVAIGEAAPEVEAAFAGRVPVTEARSMAEAVAAARRAALAGDSVLLSPGCASFDWYRSYAQRGDDFAALAAAQAEEDRQGGDRRLEDGQGEDRQGEDRQGKERSGA